MKNNKSKPRKRTMPAKTASRTGKQSPKFRSRPSDSRLQRAAFIFIFALVGVVFAWYAFAATAATSFSGSLNKKNPVRTHEVTTTASGTLTASGSVSSKGKNAGGQLTLKLKATSGTLITQATGDPATISAPVGIGSYAVEVSSDNSNANYSVDITYPVADPEPIGDTTPPTAPTSLTAQAVNTSQVNLAWQSATDNVGVASYDVLRNGIKITTTMTTSYNDVNLTPATSYSYTVRARDTAGNVSAASNTVTATTQAAADTTAPNVSITSPANGTTVTGAVNVSGTASDNVTVSAVEFRIDNDGYVPASYNPAALAWSYSLNTALFADGSHTLTIRATDSAGNQRTATISVTVKNTTPTTGDAPDTQGIWVSPEGLTIDVNTAGIDSETGKPWTIASIYRRLRNESAAVVDFATIAPSVTVYVQDKYPSMCTTAAGSTGGIYTSFAANIYLNATSSAFRYGPDSVIAHEYGHAWTYYYHYMSQKGSWANYLSFRGLAGDSRLNTSYTWSTPEIIADDYRLLLGSSLAISQRPSHLNPNISHAKDVPGLRDFLLGPYRAKQ